MSRPLNETSWLKLPAKQRMAKAQEELRAVSEQIAALNVKIDALLVRHTSLRNIEHRAQREILKAKTGVATLRALVLNFLAEHKEDSFLAEEIRQELEHTHGITIKPNTMRNTLANMIKKSPAYPQQAHVEVYERVEEGGKMYPRARYRFGAKENAPHISPLTAREKTNRYQVSRSKKLQAIKPFLPPK
jgi:chromosome segregation ATPase